MNLRKTEWVKVKIGEVVSELRNTSSKPVNDGYSNYVGFEHIEPENLSIKKFGNISDGVTFSKTFKKNDVLFGKIRAYLKKVAIAPFDGICSGDILVLRSKDEKRLSQELLPYYLTTPSFLKVAVDSSSGTTMPRTKWESLIKFDISLPPITEQTKIVSLFNSTEKVIEDLDLQELKLKSLWKRLIDDFVSDTPTFGNLLENKVLTTVSYSEIAEKINRKIDPLELGLERRIGGEDFVSSELKIKTWGVIGKDYLGPAFHMHVLPGDILYVSRNAHLRKVAFADFEGVCSNTTFVIRAKEQLLLQNLLKHIMLSEKFTKYAMSVSKGSTNPYINWKDLDAFSFQIPDILIQKEIIKILDSILDTVDQLKQQKATIKKLKLKLLSEILQ